MTIKLGDLVNTTATVEVEFMGQSANVVYRPAAVTSAFMERVEQATTVPQAAALIGEAVTEWDVLDLDEQPIAPASENTKQLPISLLTAVLRTIVGDTQPGEPTAGRSGAGSRRKGR